MIHLMIDDKRDPGVHFDVPGDGGCEIARTFTIGVDLLKINEYHTLFLDHDLGMGGCTVAGVSRNGEHVMNWLEENLDRMPMHVTLLTANPSAGQRMWTGLGRWVERGWILERDWIR